MGIPDSLELGYQFFEDEAERGLLLFVSSGHEHRPIAIYLFDYFAHHLHQLGELDPIVDVLEVLLDKYDELFELGLPIDVGLEAGQQVKQSLPELHRHSQVFFCLDVYVHVDCHSQRVHLGDVVDILHHFHYLGQQHYLLHQSLYDLLLDLHLPVAAVERLHCGFSWQVDHLVLCGSSHFHLSVQFLGHFPIDELLDLSHHLLYLLPVDLHLHRHFPDYLHLLHLLM